MAGPYSVKFLAGYASVAPLSAWVHQYGFGIGTALTVVAECRVFIEGSPRMHPRHEPGRENVAPDPTRYERFRRLVVEEIDGEPSPLEAVMEGFKLDHGEAAKLFGVRRQAVGQWLARGVPTERQAKLGVIHQVMTLLEHNVRKSLIPGIVRREANARRAHHA